MKHRASADTATVSDDEAGSSSPQNLPTSGTTRAGRSAESGFEREWENGVVPRPSDIDERRT